MGTANQCSVVSILFIFVINNIGIISVLFLSFFAYLTTLSQLQCWLSSDKGMVINDELGNKGRKFWGMILRNYSGFFFYRGTEESTNELTQVKNGT